MHRIGLIGGMSWESTAVYYRRINEQVRTRLGGLHSADIVMRSLDFDGIVALQKSEKWEDAARQLADAGRELEAAGAGILLICTNTMHKVVHAVQQAVSVPVLHIADVTGEAMLATTCRHPLLLATRYTMEQPFYRQHLADQFGLDVLVPEAADRCAVHDIIFDELCQGMIRADSRKVYLDIIARGVEKGADSVILGCTEIGLLIGPDDLSLPSFDTTLLHADSAVDFALRARRAA